MRQSQISPDAASREGAVGSIKLLINDLTCKDVFKCRRARKALVEMGDSAVPHLVDALDHRKGWVRWEAAKALGQIPGAAATAALVAALGDRSFDVRWLAAEALIYRRRDALAPLMQALIEKPDSGWFREGAHHVLFDLSQGSLGDLVRPVLEALENIDSSVEVPFKAKAVLDTMSSG